MTEMRSKLVGAILIVGLVVGVLGMDQLYGHWARVDSEQLRHAQGILVCKPGERLVAYPKNGAIWWDCEGESVGALPSKP